MLPRMLARLLEPEVMDTVEDAEEYDAMDFREANARFAEAAVALLSNRRAPRVLDLGTGTAQIPLLVCDAHPTATIVAVDLSRAMLDVARRRVAASPHGARIELRLGDAKAAGAEHGAFDLVMSNSVAHHIPDPTDLFAQIARAVRPDGAILVRDLHRPTSAEEAWAIVERVAPNDTPKQKQLFFDSLHAALTVDEVRSMAGAAGLDGTSIAIVSDRHWSLERPSRALRRDAADPR